MAWLEINVQYQHEGLVIRISDGLAELGFMPSGTLQNEGTLIIMATPPLNDEEYIYAHGAGYTFRVWIEKNFAYMQRNETILRVQVRPFKKCIHLLSGWSPNRFDLSVFSDRDFYRNRTRPMTEANTESVFVPLVLYKWAHEISLLPVKTFTSLAQFSSLLMENMKQAEQRIAESGSHASFWDYRRGETPVPKSEPQAVRAFVALLRDRAMLHGYEILQETQVGIGSLDMLAIGKHSDGRLLKIAIEGKNAHSDDLMHGLKDQLPTYMRHARADRGIYLVFWYKCKQFDLPSDTAIGVKVLLCESAPLKEISVHMADVSIPIAPSKRDHKFQ